MVYLNVLSLHISRKVISSLAGIQNEYKFCVLLLQHAWSSVMAVKCF